MNSSRAEGLSSTSESFDEQLDAFVAELATQPCRVTEPHERHMLEFELADAELRLASLPDQLAEVGARLEAMSRLFDAIEARLRAVTPAEVPAVTRDILTNGARLDRLAAHHRALMTEGCELPGRIVALRRMLGRDDGELQRLDDRFPARALAAVLTARATIERARSYVHDLG